MFFFNPIFIVTLMVLASIPDKHYSYLWYVVRHKWFVYAESIKLGIPFRGFVHDNSKFLPDEWFPYTEYFYGNRDCDLAYGFDEAWLRHQHRNPHHWQYWLLKRDDGSLEALPMPTTYIYEMLADWRGAGRAQGKPDTIGWYLKNKDKIILNPHTRQTVEYLLYNLYENK